MPIKITHFCNHCKMEMPSVAGSHIEIGVPTSTRKYKEELCGGCYREFIEQLVPLVEKYLGKPQ